MTASGLTPSAADLDAAQRILDRCDRLGAISAGDDFLERVHLSPEHAAANQLALGWLAEAGLAGWQDAAGNVCGRLEGRRPGLPALLIGSHLDTVRNAGRYDGMLGVLLAIEVAGRIAAGSGRQGAADLPIALEVVGFTDEEGTRFGNALFGSRSVAGAVGPQWLALTDADGITVAEAMRRFGLDPDRLGDAARPPAELVGYLEAHIEQGPYLEEADRPLAVVSSIAGARRFELTMIGRSGHAGGTPYERRRDALLGASEVVVEIERIARREGVIATVGSMTARPGGFNVIAGRAEFSLDLRAERDADRDRVWTMIDQRAREIGVDRRLEFVANEIYRADATVCAEPLRDAVAAAVTTVTGQAAPVLWSRAGHDGMAVSAVTGVGMLFVRNGRGGISHSPRETVTVGDVAFAVAAFDRAVRGVLATHEAG